MKKVAVLIGRMQPFHTEHLALLRGALKEGETVVVVLGSSFKARNMKNPFTADERKAMILSSVTEQEGARLKFLPVRDYNNDSMWCSVVKEGVALLTGHEPDVALIGFEKDSSSYYLKHFKEWPLIICESANPTLGATAIREALYEGNMAFVQNHVTEGTWEFLKQWVTSSAFFNMRDEFQMLRNYAKTWASAPYPIINVTVDSVVKCQDHVLLIVRDRAPGANLYALPGGFLEVSEPMFKGALRELTEETQLDVPYEDMERAFRGMMVFDHPNRSLRRIVTGGHFFDLEDRAIPAVLGTDDARHAKWVPISALRSMEDQFHDDHYSILNHFLRFHRD